jgi:ADP-ribosyl-[dinitrogen reductase] hydrolase
MTMQTEARVRGALYGLLVGDALGVPYEFSQPSDIPAPALIDMTPPLGFDRAHRGTPVGTWSDDGAQALVLLESLLNAPELDLSQFGKQLVAWYENGYMTPDGRVYDIGFQTRRGLLNIIEGVSADESGPSDVANNGNGGLMRVMPCVLVPFRDEVELIARARRQGLPTHGHVRSQLVCALYVLVAKEILAGQSAADALSKAIEALQAVTPAAEQGELTVVLDGQLEPSKGSGYVVDSFWSAMRAVLSTDNYESCVRAAIALGRDTDTTACIAGGLAGALYGESGIPARWRMELKGKTIVESLLARLPG